MTTSLSADLLQQMDAYGRAANYLSVGQIYLLDNMLYITGPGHRRPSLVANTYLEGSYTEIYHDISQDEAGKQRLFKQFSFLGYPWLIHRLTYRRTNHGNWHVRGYKEEGTTTTPFDMVVLNDLDRFRLVSDVIDPRAEPGCTGRLCQTGGPRQIDRTQAVHHRAGRGLAGDSRREMAGGLVSSFWVSTAARRPRSFLSFVAIRATRSNWRDCVMKTSHPYTTETIP